MNLGLALDNSFEIMNEDEMFDVNGGGVTRYHFHVNISANLLKALYSVGVGAAVSIVGSAVVAALGITGIGATLIPVVIGAIIGIITSYVSDNNVTSDKSFQLCNFTHWSFRNRTHYKWIHLGW